jgi:hypothetical protein
MKLAPGLQHRPPAEMTDGFCRSLACSRCGSRASTPDKRTLDYVASLPLPGCWRRLWSPAGWPPPRRDGRCSCGDPYWDVGGALYHRSPRHQNRHTAHCHSGHGMAASRGERLRLLRTSSA